MSECYFCNSPFCSYGECEEPDYSALEDKAETFGLKFVEERE